MLLHLETATAVCSAALSHNGKLIGYTESAEPRAHAQVLTVFIQQLLQEANITAEQVEAVSISAGPGSYTGLRIASSVAKGFCYAANIPLIALNTLEIMASGYLEENNLTVTIAPMIDARRDEVFTAVYDGGLNPQLPPTPLLLTAESYAEFLTEPVHFIGDGAAKFEAVIAPKANVVFAPAFYPKASHQVKLARQKFTAKQFEDVAYFEPNYLKEFYTTMKK